MKHKQYEQWLQLFLYDELDEDEKRQLEQHVEGCPDCRDELEQLKKLHAVVAQHRRVAMSHQMLTDARRDLRVTLSEKLSRPPLWERVIEPIYKISFSGVVTLAVGFVIGYVMSSTSPLRNLLGDRIADVVPILQGDSQISNVHFLDPDATDGEIEFTFDLVRPVRLKGDINDADIQKVLAHALVNSQNPGVRLRTVSALSDQSVPLAGIEVRDALLDALTSDPNPAVRREAILLLRKFPYDNEIKDAILYVLGDDQNAGVRIAAITSLEQFKDRSILKDQEVLNVLRERIQNDENNYIRLIAQTFLEENKLQ